MWLMSACHRLLHCDATENKDLSMGEAVGVNYLVVSGLGCWPLLGVFDLIGKHIFTGFRCPVQIGWFESNFLVFCLQGRISIFCSTSCCDQYKTRKNILATCEHCKQEKVLFDTISYNQLDLVFCSESESTQQQLFTLYPCLQKVSWGFFHPNQVVELCTYIKT